LEQLCLPACPSNQVPHLPGTPPNSNSFFCGGDTLKVLNDAGPFGTSFSSLESTSFTLTSCLLGRRLYCVDR
jgi:hypothetical protein